jgi:hypothetical protein
MITSSPRRGTRVVVVIPSPSRCGPAAGIAHGG